MRRACCAPILRRSFHSLAGERGRPTDDEGTGERFEATDAVAKPPLHRYLNRPADSGNECE